MNQCSKIIWDLLDDRQHVQEAGKAPAVPSRCQHDVPPEFSNMLVPQPTAFDCLTFSPQCEVPK